MAYAKNMQNTICIELLSITAELISTREKHCKLIRAKILTTYRPHPREYYPTKFAQIPTLLSPRHSNLSTRPPTRPPPRLNLHDNRSHYSFQNSDSHDTADAQMNSFRTVHEAWKIWHLNSSCFDCDDVASIRRRTSWPMPNSGFRPKSESKPVSN